MSDVDISIPLRMTASIENDEQFVFKSLDRQNACALLLLNTISPAPFS
jgi:hypothetical protein